MEINNTEELFDILNMPDEDFVKYLQNLNLLRKTYRCKKGSCRKYCSLYKKTGCNSLNFAFYCKKCKTSSSLLKGSFFEKMKIPLKTILEMIWYWSCEAKLTSTYYLTGGISKKSIVQVNRFIRDIISWKLSKEDESLGGPGHIVQIDKSIITKGKYKKGQYIPEVWILSMVDTTSLQSKIIYLKNGDAKSLIPIICHHIKEDSEIWTDEWHGYNFLKNFAYVHKPVSNSKIFKDNVNICTNRVEDLCSMFKGYCKRLGVMSSTYLPEYIDQFIWNKKYGTSAELRFKNIIFHISQKYLV